MQKVDTKDAPGAIGPYCQATIYNGMLHTSGQICIDPATNTLIEGDIKAQTHRVCKNLEAVLKAAGTDFTKVLKTTCFLANMDDFANFNSVYAEYFVSKPARSCVAVKTLPKNVLCEVELIAYI